MFKRISNLPLDSRIHFKGKSAEYSYFHIHKKHFRNKTYIYIISHIPSIVKG